ncbi:CHRD domain-containing protein [Candidatus Woesearchaeota archaeon]|nr:CHRD domain-containing protein [Candidatus Woesearchaeota archaeon]
MESPQGVQTGKKGLSAVPIIFLLASVIVISMVAAQVLNDTNQTNETATNETNITINETLNATINASINETLENETNLTANITTNLTNETTANATVNATANATAETNQTNLTNATTGGGGPNVTAQAPPAPAASLFVKSFYPKGPDYVFVCNATNFDPFAFTWFYGDGHKLINISNSDTYHVYQALGNYVVQCIATDGTITRDDTITINVTSLQRPHEPAANVTATVNQTNQTNAIVNQTANATINQTINETNQTNNETTQASFHVLLNGSNEVPPVDTNATGEANVTLNGTTLSVAGSFQNLTSELWYTNGTAAHIHKGLANETGPVSFSLEITPGEGNQSGQFNLTTKLTPEQVSELLNGTYYINIHSSNYTMGEIRGQLS